MVMNTNKLTQKSMEVIQEAQSIAVSNSNQQIDQLHLLLALLSDENGLIPELLVKMGIDASAVRDRAEDCVARLPKVTGSGRRPDEVYITQDTDRALTEAEETAKHMGDEYISVEHLFIGLIEKAKEKTKDILNLFG
ncbi:MAG: type VI secretion system ATPase TssH, partial [Ruminiclostridium sp.]|nr:type VI secretion system ATPase TssH [Ruminiclostridium sp.]